MSKMSRRLRWIATFDSGPIRGPSPPSRGSYSSARLALTFRLIGYRRLIELGRGSLGGYRSWSLLALGTTDARSAYNRNCAATCAPLAGRPPIVDRYHHLVRRRPLRLTGRCRRPLEVPWDMSASPEPTGYRCRPVCRLRLARRDELDCPRRCQGSLRLLLTSAKRGSTDC